MSAGKSFNDLYPSINSPDFVDKISQKREFFKNRRKNGSFNNSDDFVLTNNQIFLKNFISPKTPYRSILLFHGVGVGKCHAFNTKILMFNGKFKNVQDIKVGDQIMGDDSTKRNVISLGQGIDVMYKIICSDGSSFTVNEQHILCLRDKHKSLVEMTVQEYNNIPLSTRQQYTLYKSGVIKFSNNVITNQLSLSHAYELGTLYNPDINIDDIIYNNCSSIVFSFISGLFDSKASIENKEIVLQTCDDQIYFLLNSKGFNVRSHFKNGKTYIKGSSCLHLNKFDGIDTTDNNLCVDILQVENMGKGNYYGFTIDKNHRYIMEHFFVTHNTCTAINIAEQFKDLRPKHKIMVFTPRNLVDNFYKELGDPSKGENQCLGKRYIMNENANEKKIKRAKKNFYEIIGLWTLPSIVKAIKERYTDLYPKAIENMFSNRVIIIDEIHNIRIRNNEAYKILPDILDEIVLYSKNVKLILLTATPMYNDAKEIVWLLNLLRKNSGMEEIKEKEIFNGNEFDKKQFIEASRGLVSYMAGNNTNEYPDLLCPHDNKVVKHILPEMNLTGSPLSALQKQWFKENTNLKHDLEFESDVDEEDIESETRNTQSFKMLQASNIVFPGKHIGNSGIKHIFEIHENQKSDKVFTYKKGMEEIFTHDNIIKYSPKIKTILDYALQADGTVFVFSNFIQSGILPLAIALEHSGFDSYNNKNKLNLNKKNKGNKLGLKYAIFSNKDPKENANIVKIFNSKDNKDGSKIKVVLGTRIVSEGIDFKNVREVHVLDPWFHMQRNQQVVGRAVRKHSHKDLPQEKKNVTRYFHVSTNNKEKTYDIHAYETSYEKQKMIDIVENTMKEAAIDGLLNGAVLTKKVQKSISTSQKEKIIVEYNEEYVKPFAKAGIVIDDSSFELEMYMDDMPFIIPRIREVFKSKKMNTFKEISDSMKGDFDDGLLEYTLDVLVNEKRTLIDDKYLIYRHNLYILVDSVLFINNIFSSADLSKKNENEKRIILQASESKTEQQELNVGVYNNDCIKKIQKNVEKKKEEYAVKQLELFENNKQLFADCLLEYEIDRFITMKNINQNCVYEVCKAIIKNEEIDNKLIEALKDGLLLWSFGKEMLVLNINNMYFEKLIRKPEGEVFEILSPREYEQLHIKDTLNQLLKSDTGKVKGFLDKKGGFKVKSDKANSSGQVCKSFSGLQEAYKSVGLQDYFTDDDNMDAKCVLFELLLRLKTKLGVNLFLRPIHKAIIDKCASKKKELDGIGEEKGPPKKKGRPPKDNKN